MNLDLPIGRLTGIDISAENGEESVDTYIDDNGYLRFSDSGKSVARWVAERTLGRKLDPEEVVHHINRNKLDNRPENLEVFANQDEHEEQHISDGDDFWNQHF